MPSSNTIKLGKSLVLGGNNPRPFPKKLLVKRVKKCRYNAFAI
jgi:hypothetical protein